MKQMTRNRCGKDVGKIGFVAKFTEKLYSSFSQTLEILLETTNIS